MCLTAGGSLQDQEANTADSSASEMTSSSSDMMLGSSGDQQTGASRDSWGNSGNPQFEAALS